MTVTLSSVRKNVVDILSKNLCKKDDAKVAEQFIYDQAISYFEITCSTGNTSASETKEFKKAYQKLSYERLGELMSLPKQERMDYLRDNEKYFWDSDAYEEYKSKHNRRREFQVLLSTGGIKTGDIVCKRCKTKSVTYYTLQTRRADEGATVFYRCLSCGMNGRE